MGKRAGESPLDWWTLVHVGAGALIGLSGLAWPWAVGLIVGFEVLEAGLRRIRRDGKGLFEYESWPNIIVDVVVALVGYAAIRYLVPFQGPLA